MKNKIIKLTKINMALIKILTNNNNNNNKILSNNIVTKISNKLVSNNIRLNFSKALIKFSKVLRLKATNKTFTK